MTDHSRPRHPCAPYGWLITHDHLAKPGDTPGTNSNARGVTGPRNVRDDLVKILHLAVRAGKDNWDQGNVRWFRIYDDDDELYYSGVLAETDDSSDGFEPLDDFGTPNAGATEIRYYEGHFSTGEEKWEAL